MVLLANSGPLVAFILTVWLGTVASLVLFDLYRDQAPQAGRSAASPRFPRWDFTPQTLGGFSYRLLALASVLGLFLELLLIRWISSEIRIFAYFKNFVLIACFLGFGLGCHLCRRRINLMALAIPLVFLALVVKLPWPGLRLLIADLPVLLGALTEVNVWGVPSVALNWSSAGGLVCAVLLIVPVFALLALVFVPIGQIIGWQLENAGHGILGYSVNIVGSLAGILLYTLLCFLYQPPMVWFAVAGALLVAVLWRSPILRWTSAGALILSTGLASLSPGQTTEYWSPYQKLELTPRQEGGKITSYHLTTNGSWYQQIIDLSPEFVASRPDLFRDLPIQWNAYNLPYRFHNQPSSVLVLGAGMGNDVAAALRNGAQRVVAVEIDPLILEMGRRLHFEKPYDSPRVERVLDDARSYLQNSGDRFDLIVFSLLDSHTTSSHYSNIRIDNYVYTVEALEAARSLLAPDGVFIVKFQVNTPWIAGRLRGLLTRVFGRPPAHLQAEAGHTTSGRFFIAGSERQIRGALSDRAFGDWVRRRSDPATEEATLTTDDWPYFYQHEPGLPLSVLVISGVLLLLCWLALRKTGTAVRSLRWHFFFLGAGFLLLEAQIISKMALLFGTTWLVNSIVIAGLLLLIVGSNLTVHKAPRLPLWLAYAGLFLSLGVSYFLPLQKLFLQSVWLKGVAATAALSLPVFFAGIIFIRSFAQAGFRGEALGSNLLGALAGGLLESLSFWTGLRSLLILAAALYLASYFARRLEFAALRTAPDRL